LVSRPAAVSLTVTAPPHLRAGTSSGVQGHSVSDLVASLPAAAWPVVSVEVRLEAEWGDAVRAPGPVVLSVRTAAGSLVPLGDAWVSVPAQDRLSLRAIAPGGSALGAQAWRVRYRLTPAEEGTAAVEGTLLVSAASR